LASGAVRAVTAAMFLRDAEALAQRLPPGGAVINLCQDRYTFAVCFAAALLGGGFNLLSSDRSAPGLARIAEAHPGCILVADEPALDGLVGLSFLLIAPASGDAGPEPANPVLPADRLAAVVFTSGSTGPPVAHRKPWGALASRSIAAGERFGLSEAAPSSVVGTVPPQHMYGFETTVLLPLHAAAISWCGASFFPADVRAALDSVPAPRLLVTTPLTMNMLLRAGTPLPDLQAVISATAPLDAALAGQAEAAWRAPMLEIFGATEVGSIASRRTLAGAAWQLYPGLRLRPGPAGMLVEAPFAEPFPLADELAILDAARFELRGRRTDIVKLGGRRASLPELDRILAGLDGVEDCAFLLPDAMPDTTSHQHVTRLLAFVVAPDRDTDSILGDLRGRLDPLFVPRRIIRVAALPRNSLGKLPRQRLLGLLAAAEAGEAG
jgi:acyl-coenzyme A synthetase/AMP-(fatty) acid ligase